MRIIAVRVRPVCIAFSCLYAVVGLLAFVQFCFVEDMQQFTLPVGIIAPFVHFNINLNVPRSMTSSQPILYAVWAVLAYAVSGCISGLAATYLFNLIAGVMGGIDARFVKIVDEQAADSEGIVGNSGVRPL
jgi:hypothetical protein